MGALTTHDRTADHEPPERAPSEGSAPALVVAFPQSMALALPAASIPIGRRWLAEHRLADREVSGEHLAVERTSGGVYVRDLQTRNGTWLDGQPLTPGERVPLEDGAVLRMGRILMVYREALATRAPAPPIGGLVGPYGLRDLARTLAAWIRKPPFNVLIDGETGTGKELAARAIAEALGRSKPYTAVNVAGVAAGVFESQLFGHVAGAFSDARRASKGVIAAHEGGTVFLDEIGELPLTLQPKVLRLIENRELMPVGADAARDVDVLLLAATNRDLEQLVEEGAFRRDLFARMKNARVHLPRLADRCEDIFAIAQALRDLAAEDIEVEAMERLMLEPWPNNVRDLIALLDGVATHDDKPGLRLWAVDKVLGPRGGPPPRLTPALVTATLDACAGSERQAARKLGVSRGKLRRFLKKDK